MKEIRFETEAEPAEIVLETGCGRIAGKFGSGRAIAPLYTTAAPRSRAASVTRLSVRFVMRKPTLDFPMERS
jgi:hypothetical protein